MAWRVARSLDALLAEVNDSAPKRSKLSDGSIGDARHSSRRSDHNPCECCAVVCARDFTHDPEGGFDAGVFSEWLRQRVLAGEPRVKYVIFRRRIFSGRNQRHPAGLWRRYYGTNPHTSHVHVSVDHGADLYDSPTPWEWHPKGGAHETPRG